MLLRKWTRLKEFRPSTLLRNAHLMTIAAALWPRRFPALPSGVPRFFEVEPGTQVRGDCHWHRDLCEHATLVLLHGLEGSSESRYMLGTAEKAWIAGFNVIRLNQRNCGGTEQLTSTLYHSGRSGDVRAVILELIERDGLPEIFAAGFSMGGNLVLKMAGEFADSAPPQVRGFAAIVPCFDLAACADAIGERRNFIYNRHFVKRLRTRMRDKARLFPKIYAADRSIEGLNNVHTVREFDNAITAPFCGFASADDYYARSSATHVLGAIARPALILTAQDDPFVPFSTFGNRAMLNNPNITLLAPKHGGHCGFISREEGAERFWSEARIVDFCKQHSKLASGR
jgi:predicted alpha/beta-fold hydrolase